MQAEIDSLKAKYDRTADDRLVGKLTDYAYVKLRQKIAGDIEVNLLVLDVKKAAAKKARDNFTAFVAGCAQVRMI